MIFLDTLRSLVTRDATIRLEAARTQLNRGNINMARWHLDHVVAQLPDRAEVVADWCVALEEPRLAKRYYKRVVATCEPPSHTLLWHLGQQYLALAAQTPKTPRATDLRRKAMDALLRAEATEPAAYGPHASRLRALLDQNAQYMFRRDWAEALDTGSWGGRGYMDKRLARPIAEELVATQTLLPEGNELLAVVNLLRTAGPGEVETTVLPLLLPLLRALLLQPRADEALEGSALGALCCLAWVAADKQSIRSLLMEYAERGKLARGTLDDYLRVWDKVSTSIPATLERDVDTLLNVAENHRDPQVAEAMVQLLSKDRKARAAGYRTPLPNLPDPLVALPADEGWKGSLLGPAIADDHVLNLDVARALCVQIDAPTAALLNTHLSAAQRRVLNELSAAE